MESSLMFFNLLLFLSGVLCQANIKDHVRNQMMLGQDQTSFSQKRICELYSKATGYRVRIRGKRVDANGRPGDAHALVEISSVSFGGVITIRGVETGRYLCMNKKGRLIGKMKKITNTCHFRETLGENYFDTFTNMRHPKWRMAFNANGRPKRGPRATEGRPEVMFLMLKRKNVLTTIPASGRKKEALDKFRDDIRKKYLDARNEDSEKIAPTDRMQGDDPNVFSNPTTVAPEIQKELEYRRSLALKHMSWTTSDETSSPTGSYNLLLQDNGKKSVSKSKRRNRQTTHRKSRKNKSDPGRRKDKVVEGNSAKHRKKKTSSFVSSKTSTAKDLNALESGPTLHILQRPRFTKRVRIGRTRSKSLKKLKRRITISRQNLTKDIT